MVKVHNGRRVLVRGMLLAAAALFALSNVSIATAQSSDFPNAPLKLVIAYSPGGGNDVYGRAVAERMGRELGQPIIVENIPGADGQIGTEAAAPDGYTLYLGSLSTLGMLPYSAQDAGFHPIESFDAVGLIANTASLLVVHRDVPVSTFEEFIAYAKERPGELNYASTSQITTLPMELLKIEAGIDMVRIPYAGTSPAMVDFLANRVSVLSSSSTSLASHIQSGSVTPLATFGTVRSTAFPELPTIGETYPGFATESWWGLFVPKGTPEPIIETLNQALNASLADPDLIKEFESRGDSIVTGTPEDLAATLANDYEKWGEVVEQMAQSEPPAN